jgi:hypothetical protein
MAIRSDTDFLNKIAQEIVTSGYTPTISQVEAFIVDKEENPFEAFERFIRRLLKKLEGKKLVLTFDEYELLETHFDNNIISEQILRLLGNLIEHKNLFIVFTGSDKLEARNKKYWDILAKGQNKRISFLTRNDTLRLIREPLEDVIQYGEGVSEAIADLTAGQPFYTQVLCQTLVDHLNEEEKYDVTDEDLQRVVNEVIVNPLPQMIFHWNTLPAVEKLCLSIIAEITRHDAKPVTASDITAFADKEELGYRFDANALKKALENLFKGDLLVKSADEDTYLFKMGLWRLWITRMHSVWQVIDEMERKDEIPPELTPVVKSSGRKWVYGAAALVLVLALAASFFMRDFFRGSSNDVPGGRGRDPVEYAGFNLRSVPSGAEVRVDGNRLGWTPLNDSVPVGEHEIAIAYAGCRTFIDTMLFVKGEVADTTITLSRVTGSVRVESDPPGAVIWLDNENTGLTTPRRLTDLPVTTSHTVSLVLSGYNRYTFPPISPVADSTITITRDLSKRTGILTIHSQPQGASYELGGGTWTGTTPGVVSDIEYGRQRLLVKRQGYEDWVRTIEIPYPDNKIVVTLSRLPDGYFEFKIFQVGDVYINGVAKRTEVTHVVLPVRPNQNHTVEIKRGNEVILNEIYQVAPGDTLEITKR